MDAGEECDEGAERNRDVPGSRCRTDCSHARCADHIQDQGETCDDGNLLNGDSCSDVCQREYGAAPTMIAFPGQNLGIAGLPAQYPFPGFPSSQWLPGQMPFASLQPLMASRPPVGDTGPAAVVVIAAGAASGVAWIRRKRRN